MFVVWSCLLLGVIVGLLGSGFVAGLFWYWMWVGVGCGFVRFCGLFCGFSFGGFVVVLCVGCYVVVGLLDCS